MVCIQNNCMVNTFASVWINLYQVLMRSKSDVDSENNEIRMSLVQSDLHTCTNRLNSRCGNKLQPFKLQPFKLQPFKLQPFKLQFFKLQPFKTNTNPNTQRDSSHRQDRIPWN
jgi:hypothetical protein